MNTAEKHGVPRFPINYEAWARNMIIYIREKGLESDFTDWCGGWPCPVNKDSAKDATSHD